MIRVATVEDAEEILKIYDYYVRNTAITFEYVTPTIEEFRERIKNTLKAYPYLVYEREGKIVGYSYAGRLHPRKAYDWSVETTIYVDKDERRSGIGKELYEALEKILAKMNVTNVCACIAYPDVEDEHLTKNSVEYHGHLGYKMIGIFNKCAYKFDTWYNMVWMEKIIAEHKAKPDALINFNAVNISGILG